VPQVPDHGLDNFGRGQHILQSLSELTVEMVGMFQAKRNIACDDAQVIAQIMKELRINRVG
jgi:hypothetical protein